MRRVRWLAALVTGAFPLAACGNPQVANRLDGRLAPASGLGDHTHTEVWDGKRGLGSERCELAGGDLRPASGWIHWVFSTKGGSDNAQLTLGGTGYGTFAPGPPAEAEVWHFYTPFFELDGLSAQIELFGGNRGPGGGLVISGWCAGEGRSLEVTKTATAEFTRTHDWSIAKSVDPEEPLLYVDGSGDGDVEWTVEVTYEGSVDAGFVVHGDITIKSISTQAKTIASIADDLGFPGKDDIAVDCGVTFPYTLPAGETLTCSHSELLECAKQGDAGTNIVTVVVEGEEADPYYGEAVWGFEQPTTEVHAHVYVTDTNDGSALEYGDEDGNVELRAVDSDAGERELLLHRSVRVR